MIDAFAKTGAVFRRPHGGGCRDGPRTKEVTRAGESRRQISLTITPTCVNYADIVKTEGKNETDFSAKQYQTKTDPWFPREDELKVGSKGDQQEEGERQKASGRLTCQDNFGVIRISKITENQETLRVSTCFRTRKTIPHEEFYLGNLPNGARHDAIGTCGKQKSR